MHTDFDIVEAETDSLGSRPSEDKQYGKWKDVGVDKLITIIVQCPKAGCCAHHSRNSEITVFC